MKHLYANGDSSTHGDELGVIDENGTYDKEYRNTHCYVGQLAKLYNLDEYFNDSVGGGSNDRIYRRTLKFVSEWIASGRSPEDLFVVIGWSNASRTEFYYEPRLEEGDEFNKTEMSKYPEEERRYYPIYVGIHKSKLWNLHEDDVLKDFAVAYNRWFSSLPASMTRTLSHIVGLQGILKSFRIPYVFTNAGWILEIEKTQSQALASMVDEKRFIGMYDRMETFSGWTWKSGFQGRMPMGHPDEKAHAAWARRLKSYIEEHNLREAP